jgi:hypothetical protein
MPSRNLSQFKHAFAISCGWILLLGLSVAQAVTTPTREQRPRINLFPTAVVESLSETSTAALAMENRMYAVVEKLEQQSQAYQRTGCEGSTDAGCLQLRKAIRGTYKQMLEVMQNSLPEMRETLGATAAGMGDSLRSELGRKMTPADIQRVLAGRPAAGQAGALATVPGRNEGKLSRMFSRYYDLVRRGGGQADALPVLAAQVYLDSVQSLYFLDLIEAELGSQNTELVLELEWGELTEQISTTVSEVKTLLWGEEADVGEILEVGLEAQSTADSYSDLLVR